MTVFAMATTGTKFRREDFHPFRQIKTTGLPFDPRAEYERLKAAENGTN